jgi:hypothetical protein
MERGSDKHSSRVDDEMEKETSSVTHGSPVESRADEARMKEPPGDEEPMPEDRIDSDRP